MLGDPFHLSHFNNNQALTCDSLIHHCHHKKVFTFSISARQMKEICAGVMVDCYGPMNHVFKEFGVNIGFAHFQVQNPGF